MSEEDRELSTAAAAEALREELHESQRILSALHAAVRRRSANNPNMNRLLATLASALDEIEVQLKAARTGSTGSCAPRRSR
jgi:2,3-bisphosphoglycerate-independent phosphoglycerate mutase